MRSWLARVVRRTLAFTVDLAILGAIAALVMWEDDRTGFLYGYNTEQIGNSFFVAWFMVSEVSSRTTVGKKLMGLTIRSADGAQPRRSQLAFRSLLFWIAIMAPLTFSVHSSVFSWLLDDREQWIALFSYMFAIVLLPACSCLLSREAIGVHDFLTNTKVVRVKDPVARGNSRLAVFHWGWSPRLYATATLLFVSLTGILLSADWSLNIGSAIASTFRVNNRYFETALAGADRSIAEASSLSASLTDAYVTSSPHLVLPGLTQHYTVPVRRSLLTDHDKAIEVARALAIQQLRFGAPSGLKWIVVELSNARQFGLFRRTFTLPCLVDLTTGHVLFPPVEVDDTLLLARGESAFSLSAWIDGKLTPIKVVHGRPRVERMFGVMSTWWDFPSFDLLSKHDLSPPETAARPR